MKRLSRYRPRPSLKIVPPVQCVPTGHPNHDETTRLHVSRPYFRNRFQRGVYFGFPFWRPVSARLYSKRPFAWVGCVRGPFVRLSTPSAGSHGGRTCRKRPGSGALLEHLSRVASTLHRCFRHQLLLPRPYLVLTKPLRLDIKCQRAASVKIGWKYLDDYGLTAALVHNSRSRSIIALHPEIRGPA